MSKEKHQALIKAKQLNKDGTPIERCPVCGTELTAEQAEAIRGAAAGVGEPANPKTEVQK